MTQFGYAPWPRAFTSLAAPDVHTKPVPALAPGAVPATPPGARPSATNPPVAISGPAPSKEPMPL